jgi:HPt (histidine-containing phosphotransfer) domain-containing protein
MKSALSRRLDLTESRNVAQQLDTHAATLKAEKRTLQPKTKSALKLVLETGAHLRALSADASFQEIDREVDAGFGNFFRTLSAITGLYSGARVPLTADLRALQEAAQTLDDLLRNHDRRLVQLPYREQYDAMQRMMLTLQKPEAVAALATLGLPLAAQRLGALTDAYGRGLGFLETKTEEPTAAIGPFQDALAKLLVHIASEHDGDGEDDVRIRTLLLSPYEDAVERVRAADAADRRRSRAKKNGG